MYPACAFILKGLLRKGSPGTLRLPGVWKLEVVRKFPEAGNRPVASKGLQRPLPLTMWRFSLCHATRFKRMIFNRFFTAGRPKMVISAKLPESTMSIVTKAWLIHSNSGSKDWFGPKKVEESDQ